MLAVGRALPTCAIAFCLGLFPAGCQGDYPIAPTPCDRWCEARKDTQCGYYDPAGCVAACESSGISAPRCVEALEAATECFERAEIPCDEEDPYFYYPGPYPCVEEETALYACPTLR